MTNHEITVDRLIPESNGPRNGPSWYDAGAYCNWLSEQEGLPRDQWCYLPNESGAYAEGMTIPANVLARRGYRLPTEAEWEYVCRAGVVTSRYYGNSLDLLDRYSWYQGNSKDHAWACGSLLPNDQGLFDMLGNLYEWVQDSERKRVPGKRRLSSDQINVLEYLNDKYPRRLRGGSFNFQPAGVRSADRFRVVPASHLIYYGFRPSRTYP